MRYLPWPVGHFDKEGSLILANPMATKLFGQQGVFVCLLICLRMHMPMSLDGCGEDVVREDRT